MTTAVATLALPTADRVRAHAFYGAGLGFETPGEPADDGVPEPLTVQVNDGFRIMCIPTGGFGWVTAGRTVAESGTVECLLTLAVDRNEDVDAFVERARLAGAEIAIPPQQEAWGYCGTFADPDGHLWTVLVP